MGLYNLKRMSDDKLYAAQRDSADAAMFYFSVLVGEALSFDGAGPPPYLLGSRVTPVGAVNPTIPVYRRNG